MEIEWCFTVTLEEAQKQDELVARLDSHFNRLMEELVKLVAVYGTVRNPEFSVGFAASPGVVLEVGLIVDEKDEAKALDTGQSVLRAAIRRSGGHEKGTGTGGGPCYEQVSMIMAR
ncbi:hypothetical protein ACFQ69_34985 [Streptomyces sp. NPDC056470]|uniref:hypothetical protein n=1 Tax=Streptomyces sp. NPDC056470 TaxID=3345831 RepID=UPI00368A990E